MPLPSSFDHLLAHPVPLPLCRFDSKLSHAPTAARTPSIHGEDASNPSFTLLYSSFMLFRVVSLVSSYHYSSTSLLSVCVQHSCIQSPLTLPAPINTNTKTTQSNPADLHNTTRHDNTHNTHT
jgi:hypothetical protein